MWYPVTFAKKGICSSAAGGIRSEAPVWDFIGNHPPNAAASVSHVPGSSWDYVHMSMNDNLACGEPVVEADIEIRSD
jgi:hypothetical protein